MSLPTTSREWHLVARPHGEPQPSDFELVEVPVRAPGDGEVVVRNLFLSVDPYMRGRMNDVKSYVPPYALGEPMEGGAVGQVVASNAETHAVGDLVLHMQGWREVAVGPAAAFSVRPAGAASPSHHLGVLGMPGLTAYAGLFEVAGFSPGETVFVSGAAGAVGSLVGQLAKAHGGRAIGSAGSAEKVRWLTEELGFDAAFDYKAGPVAAQLRAAAPDGIDVYFDNVGGEHLEAAIGSLTVHGRVAVCGMISQYNATTPAAAPRNLTQVVAKRLRITGFLVSDHGHLRRQFLEEVTPMIADGRLTVQETVVDGIDAMVEAFRGLLSGGNTGKMVVRLASA